MHVALIDFREAYDQVALDLTRKSDFIYDEGIRQSLQLGDSNALEKAFQFSEWSKGASVGRGVAKCGSEAIEWGAGELDGFRARAENR